MPSTAASLLRFPPVLPALLLTAANLRPSFMGVGPLLKDIQADTGLGSTALGALMTLPVVAFATVSPLAAALARRFGLERVLLAAVLLLAAGIGVRALPGTAFLFGGTAVLGAAIALGNVLLPALVRRDFGARIGVAMSVFVTVLAGMAALGAGLAVPLAERLGWRGALAVWALPALLAALAWLPQWRSAGTAAPTAPAAGAAHAGVDVWRSPLAWQVTAFMGLQSLAFYVLVAWQPALLQDHGFSKAGAGGLAFVFQLACLAGSMAAPLLARGRDQRVAAVASALAIGVGFAGHLTHTAWTAWTLCAGLGCGASLALSMTFVAARADDAHETAALAGMSQSMGYCLAALGPVTFGALQDASGGWALPIAAVLVLVAAQAVCGWRAGRPTTLRAARALRQARLARP